MRRPSVPLYGRLAEASGRRPSNTVDRNVVLVPRHFLHGSVLDRKDERDTTIIISIKLRIQLHTRSLQIRRRRPIFASLNVR